MKEILFQESGNIRSPQIKMKLEKPYPRSTGSGNIKLIYGDAAAGGSTSTARKHKSSEEGPSLDDKALKKIKAELRSANASSAAAQPESPNSFIMLVEDKEAEEEVATSPTATATIRSETADIATVSMVKIVRDLEKHLSNKFEVSFNRNKGANIISTPGWTWKL